MSRESKLFMPPGLERSLVTFGRNISIARRKRNLTVASMAMRIGVAENTYAKIERGSPSVNLGAYAMALHVLGYGSAFADLLDVSKDDQGCFLRSAGFPSGCACQRRSRSHDESHGSGLCRQRGQSGTCRDASF